MKKQKLGKEALSLIKKELEEGLDLKGAIHK